MRIEDTDRERSTAESEEKIREDLRWLGLDWDEGPVLGGAWGPYRQSDRLEIYKKYSQILTDEGKAYSCFCTPEELDRRRRERVRRGESAAYDGRCRELTAAEIARFEEQGRRPSLRFRVDEGELAFDDVIKGSIAFRGENIGDFIVIRPDGMPMYNFACVVDDHLMEISHVIRGDDHVSNTPRQCLVYSGFGWKVPRFAHIPMILGEDREPLSKRHGASSVAQLRQMGILPEALVNFLSLLSWSSESGEEILSPDRLIKEFDFQRVSNSAAVFDREKLDWMNGVTIRNLSLGRLSEVLYPFMKEAGFPVSSVEEVTPVADALQDKMNRLNEIREKAKIFFQDRVAFDDAETERLVKTDDARRVFLAFLDETAELHRWDAELFSTAMKNIQDKTGIKGKALWMPIRAALTGQVHGPDLSRVVGLLGLEKCRRFIEKLC